MSSVDQALAEIIPKNSTKYLVHWTTKFESLESARASTLTKIRWTFFVLSILGTVFGFGAMMDLIRAFVNEDTINLASAIEVTFWAWIVGKLDRAFHVLGIDINFRKLVGEDNIGQKYREVMRIIETRNIS